MQNGQSYSLKQATLMMLALLQTASDYNVGLEVLLLWKLSYWFYCSEGDDSAAWCGQKLMGDRQWKQWQNNRLILFSLLQFM